MNAKLTGKKNEKETDDHAAVIARNTYIRITV